jgi:hypothetical protein
MAAAPPVEAPQSFTVGSECRQAAERNDYRLVRGEHAGWAEYGSTTAPGTLWLAAGGMHGPWYLALDHPGVAAELGLDAAAIAGPGITRHGFATLGELYRALDRLYTLAISLPDLPLSHFRARTAALPRTTEAERMVIARIGQDVFRDGPLAYWQGRCPLTGIAEPALLRASHIVPWADCASDAERLDAHNGLLLSALWDAAFDRGLVTFGDAGEPIFAPGLGEAARTELRRHRNLKLTDGHRTRPPPRPPVRSALMKESSIPVAGIIRASFDSVSPEPGVARVWPCAVSAGAASRRESRLPRPCASPGTRPPWPAAMGPARGPRRPRPIAWRPAGS